MGYDQPTAYQKFYHPHQRQQPSALATPTSSLETLVLAAAFDLRPPLWLNYTYRPANLSQHGRSHVSRRRCLSHPPPQPGEYESRRESNAQRTKKARHILHRAPCPTRTLFLSLNGEQHHEDFRTPTFYCHLHGIGDREQPADGLETFVEQDTQNSATGSC